MIRLALLHWCRSHPLLHYALGLPPIWVFVAGIAGVGILADWIRSATEQLAEHTGPAIGGLLTISLGSLAELLLALFVLARGQAKWCMRRSPARSSAPACSAWGLPSSPAVSRAIARPSTGARAGQLSSMLILIVIALLLPAVFDYTSRSVAHSPGVAGGTRR